MQVNLSDVKPGDCAIIKKIGSKGLLRRRMVDMGLTPGTFVKVVKYAPFGDPIQIKIHDYDLSVRRSEADDIEIFKNEKEASAFFKSEKNSKLKSERKIVPFLASPLTETSKHVFTTALIGNPNSGKTTLFNSLTGSYQYVGNWPGVTVERKEGRIRGINEMVNLVDLPGVYSLSPYSPEEVITREYILNECPDLIINILDATNLERSLYLTTQLLELDFPVVLALNMTDLLFYKGKVIDYKVLEKELGAPVVPISAGKNKGIDLLLNKISDMYISKKKFRHGISIYSEEVEHALSQIENLISKDIKYIPNSRFKVIKIFENDPYVMSEARVSSQDVVEIENIRNHVSFLYSKEKDMIIPDERYEYVMRLCKVSIKSDKKVGKISFSDKVDKILTGKHSALPCFFIFVFLIFYITFGPIGSTLKHWCEKIITDNTYYTMEKVLNYLGASAWCKSLVLDSIIGGVGAVIAFLPQVILLFTLLSILEDCGYMARAAFVMDRPFRKIGLSGKAFVPLIMGFGCTVPAVMGTKILENKRDKNLTIFLIPFMSCSAKMPVYLLFASAFFPHHQTAAILSLYGVGIAVGIFTAWIFKESVFKGNSAPFIMEMPEYKIPSLKNVWLSVWDRTKDFIERAGTVILIATLIVWCLQSFSFNFQFVTDNSQSILAKIGGFIAPIFSICGFGNWESAVALLTGVMAKESIVSTFSVLYKADNSEQLSNILTEIFPLRSAISFMIFTLLYTPCVAALSAIHKELGNYKLTILSLVYQFFMAYVSSALIYQVLSLISKCVGG